MNLLFLVLLVAVAAQGLLGCASQPKQLTNCSYNTWGASGPGYSYMIVRCDQGDIQVNWKVDPVPKGQPALPSITWGAEMTVFSGVAAKTAELPPEGFTWHVTRSQWEAAQGLYNPGDYKERLTHNSSNITITGNTISQTANSCTSCNIVAAPGSSVTINGDTFSPSEDAK